MKLWRIDWRGPLTGTPWPALDRYNGRRRGLSGLWHRHVRRERAH